MKMKIMKALVVDVSEVYRKAVVMEVEMWMDEEILKEGFLWMKRLALRVE